MEECFVTMIVKVTKTFPSKFQILKMLLQITLFWVKFLTNMILMSPHFTLLIYRFASMFIIFESFRKWLEHIYNTHEEIPHRYMCSFSMHNNCVGLSDTSEDCFVLE